jgi:hypothetical protein
VAVRTFKQFFKTTTGMKPQSEGGGSTKTAEEEKEAGGAVKNFVTGTLPRLKDQAVKHVKQHADRYIAGGTAVGALGSAVGTNRSASTLAEKRAEEEKRADEQMGYGGEAASAAANSIRSAFGGSSTPKPPPPPADVSSGSGSLAGNITAAIGRRLGG